MSVLQTLRRLDATIFPRRDTERRVLVDSRTPLNFEMVAPVVRRMKADPRVRFAFTASEDSGRLHQVYAGCDADAGLVTPTRAALGRWDAYLTSDFMWATLPRGTRRIQMFHGVAGKYGFDAPTRSLRSWDRLFFVNERRLRNVVAAGALDAGSPAIRLVGMPKVDCLVDGSLHRDQVLADLGLDPSRPTVLYAPTWSPASSLNAMGVALLEGLLPRAVNVVVKLHDRSRDLRAAYSGGVDWVGRLTPLLDRPNARLAPGANIAPLLAAADVLVTDHSSAGFEYLLLDRPLVRIDMPALIESAHVHPDYARLLADVSENVQTARDAADAVERALAAPGQLAAARRRVAADLFYQPGTATLRCAAALYDVLELDPHPAVVPAGGFTACAAPA